MLRCHRLLGPWQQRRRLSAYDHKKRRHSGARRAPGDWTRPQRVGRPQLLWRMDRVFVGRRKAFPRETSTQVGWGREATFSRTLAPALPDVAREEQREFSGEAARKGEA